MVREIRGDEGYCAHCGFYKPLRVDGYNPAIKVCERCWDPPAEPEPTNFDDDIVIPGYQPEPAAVESSKTSNATLDEDDTKTLTRFGE